MNILPALYIWLLQIPLSGWLTKGAEDQRQKYLGPGHIARAQSVGHQNPDVDTQTSHDLVDRVGQPQHLKRFLLQVGLEIGGPTVAQSREVTSPKFLSKQLGSDLTS